MKLRSYQKEAITSIVGAWGDGYKRVLLVLPTGTGKTVVFAKIAEHEVRAGGRVLILAHMGELLEQAANKLEQICGVRCAIDKANSHAAGTLYRVVLGSRQTLGKEKRLREYAKNYFSLIIIDEAHHTPSASYQHILQYFSGARVLGVTATPDRGDGKGLDGCFDTIAYEYSLYQAIKDGYLSHIRAKVLPVKISLQGAHIQNGDYLAKDVGHAIEPYLENIADQMVTYCKDRKTVVFLPLVKTAEKFRDILQTRGFRAIAISGKTDLGQRKQILMDIDRGKYNVICNSMLLTEGWDCPSVDCVVVLRATKSRGLYCQMVGRGTRLCTGKDHLLLLDFLWNTDKHDLCKPADLVGANEDIRGKISDMLETTGKPKDLIDAESTAIQDREASLAEKLAAHEQAEVEEIDPVTEKPKAQESRKKLLSKNQFRSILGNPIELRPRQGDGVLLAKSKELLEGYGIDSTQFTNQDEATVYINLLNRRNAYGLATPKQLKVLARYQYEDLATMTKSQASGIIAKLAKNNWKPIEKIERKGKELTWKRHIRV